MRTRIPLLALACALLMVGSPHPASGGGARVSADPLARLDRNPYDYAARRELVEQRLAAREHTSAYYHAAGLYWLAPKQHAEAGFGYLSDRRLRERARAAGPEGAVSIVVGAVTARQRLVDACLRGTIATQTSFLQREVSQLLAEAERNARVLAKGDPVVRAALADLSLTLDDALRFEGGSGSRRERLKVLRRAAGLAEISILRFGSVVRINVRFFSAVSQKQVLNIKAKASALRAPGPIACSASSTPVAPRWTLNPSYGIRQSPNSRLLGSSTRITSCCPRPSAC